jgi:hypothetical protein
MKFGFFVIIFVFVLSAIPTSALELKDNEREERDERNLRIELEAIPAPVQQDFDKYIQDLAASAQRDARAEEEARKDQAAKDYQRKVLNPIVLFRW